MFYAKNTFGPFLHMQYILLDNMHCSNMYYTSCCSGKTVKAKQLHCHTEYCAYYYFTSQEWPGLFNALQTDLSYSKESNEKYNKELLDMKAKLSIYNSQAQDETRLLQVRQLHVYQ